MSKSFKTTLFVLLLANAACTVQDTPAPPLAGPSGFALNIVIQAVPDTIQRDGASQTVILIEATGADGRPVRGLPLRVDITFGGVIFDFGTLSARNVVTGDDGRVRVTYTSPPRAAEPVDNGEVVTIVVTPVGNDFRGAASRTVDIRLLPVGIIQPPNDRPQARFTFSPTTPNAFTTVTFDASTSLDEGVPCGSRCTYTWDFGDGGTASGIFTTHQFRTVSTFQVRLTVTDARGASDITAQSITVGAGTPPTASFVFSPTNPAAGQLINFNASASRAAPGRTIVSYRWDFGSGSFGDGPIIAKGYNTPGTYNVTLTVTDDAGQVGTATQSVTVGGSGTGPQASLTVSPSAGTPSTNFFFDASASSTTGATIVEYRFTFGDGTPDVVGTSRTTTHRYATAGSYTARVTIRDSLGRTATATTSVNVQ